jgi:tyrosine-protein kinase Etk/Wzc
VTQDPDNNDPQNRAAERLSHAATVRAEGPRSLLPGPGGLTPLVDPLTGSSSGQRAGGWHSRIWAARRWWLAPLFALLGAAAAAWPIVRTPAPVVPINHSTHALVRCESTGGRSRIGANARAGRADNEIAGIVRAELQLIAEPQACALAARNGELQRALPWLATQNPDDPSAQREIARKLKPLFTATLLSGTELVRFESTDAGAAGAAVCNAFADLFIARCQAGIPKPAETDAEPILARIRELQAKKQELNKQTSAFDIDQQQVLAARQIENFIAEKSKASERRLLAAARLERLGQPSADGIVERFARLRQQRLDDEKARDPLYQQAFKDQIASAKDYAGERGAGKTELHRDVILAADRMHRAEAMAAERLGKLSAMVDTALAREQAAAISDAKAEAAEAVKVADQQIAENARQLAEWEKKSHDLGVERARRVGLQADITQIDVDLQRENARYDKIPDAIAKARSEPAYSFSIIRRAEPAPISETPKSSAPAPNQRLKTAAIFAGGGLCIGLFLTFATGALRPPRRPAPVVACLAGGSLLGVIPLAAVPKRGTASQQKAAQLRVAEGFRHLRNTLLVQLGPTPQGDPHTLCIASATRGEGRSCIASGLAVSLAKAGRRVLLVDADLRKPDLHRIFSLPVSPGLCELIEGKADPGDAIVRTDTAHLSFLPAGAALADPGELLAWPDIGSYLSAIGRLYDHVVIDSAALLETADAHHLIGCVSGVLLVSVPGADATAAGRAMELLRARGAKLVGAVVNRA